MRSLSICNNTGENAEDAENRKSLATAVVPKQKMGVGKGAFNLPSIHSSEWEFEEVQLPPSPKPRLT